MKPFCFKCIIFVIYEEINRKGFRDRNTDRQL